MQDNSYFSKKVSFLNAFLTCLIVVLHANTPEMWGLDLNLEYPFIYCCTILCRMGVPLFFFLSALLFYKACTFSDLEKKLKRRVHSLVIPYLVWNAIFVGIFFLLIHVPFLNNLMHVDDGLNSFKEIFYAIVNARYTVLWFVKDLMIFLLFAPIILMLTTKRQMIVAIIASLALFFVLDFGYESIWRWLPIYLQGAYVGKFMFNKETGSYTSFEEISPAIKGNRLLLSVVFGVIVIALYALTLWNEDLFMNPYVIISPILVWLLMDLVLKQFILNKFRIRKWMSYTFIIYCTHQFILNVLQKFVVLTCEPTALVLNLTYIISPVVAIAIAVLIGRFLSQFKFYPLLSGGR